MLEKYLQIHPEVQKSISAGEPVVALGSDIISNDTHYPKNINVTNDICKVIRNCGAIPATIAIIDGILKVGLTEEEIELLSLNKNIINADRKDIPFVISRKQTCSTTIAASIVLANLAGIKVFATSHLQGVRRESDNIFDISTDLRELVNTDIAVICSGINSTLNIGSALEYLNTNGVPVIGYKTNEISSSYERKNSFAVDYNIDSPLEISIVLKAKWDLKLRSGVLIVNPIINDEIEDSNIQLIYNNAKLAADITKNLYKLYKSKL